MTRYKGGDYYQSPRSAIRAGKKKYFWYVKVGENEFSGHADTALQCKEAITSTIKMNTRRPITPKRKRLRKQSIK